MRKQALAMVAAIATCTAFSAFAADLPSRKAAPAYAPPPPMWTGFYAGLNAGYNFGTNSNVTSQNWGAPWIGTSNDYLGVDKNLPGTAPISMDAFASNTQSGFIGGGQIGYNYQVSANIVLGVEADIQGSSIRGSSFGGGAAQGQSRLQTNTLFPIDPLVDYYYDSTSLGSTAVQGGVDWLGTVRGRIGYLWTPTLLVYGTGGLAYGNSYANVTQSASELIGSHRIGRPYLSQDYWQTNSWNGAGRQNQILTGWTAGGGVEWMFMPNWSLKAEALYWDLGRMNIQTSSYGVSGVGNTSSGTVLYNNYNVGWGRTSVSYQGVIARAGVNYHFNWGAAPVVASY